MQNITLSQIHAFERSVRLGSFHAAAQSLGLTQPAISQRIRELEQNLGVQLFVREGRRVRISADGEALLTYADQLMKTTNELIQRMSSQDPLKGILRLGVSENFAYVCLPPLLDRLARRYPVLKTALHIGDSNAVSERLNEQKLDLAVASEPQVADYIHRKTIGFNPHAWFASTRIAFDKEVLEPEDIARHSLIVTPPPARHNATVNNWFRQAGIVPERLNTCNNLATTVMLIANGFCLGLMPIQVMRDHVERGLVRQLKVTAPVPSHQVWVCYQVEELGPNLRQVVDMIEEVVRETQLYVQH